MCVSFLLRGEIYIETATTKQEYSVTSRNGGKLLDAMGHAHFTDPLIFNGF